MTTSEILRAAAERVRQGWCRFSMVDGAGNVCAYGAIENVLAADWFMANRVACFAENALRLEPNFNLLTRRLAQWNDQFGQTAENVAVGLEYAALIWEQEQAAKPHPDVALAGRMQ